MEQATWAAGAAAPKPRAPWAALLGEAYPDAPLGAGTAPAEERERFIDPAAPVLFEELYVPLVRTARAHVRRRAADACDLLGEEAHAALERSLLVRVAEVCARVVFGSFAVYRTSSGGALLGPSLWDADGGPPRALYRAFAAEMRSGGLARLFREYRVAARLCDTLAGLWVDAAVELILRARADLDELGRAFGGGMPLGTIDRLHLGAGDTHDGGRSVAIVRFTSGVRVVYKPRPIGLELVYNEVAARLAAEPDAPAIPALTYVSRPTHGWIEFVGRAPCADEEEVREFYARTGVLLAVVHALNGHDFHRENLIASGPRPVLIDMETLVRHGMEIPPSADFGFMGQETVRSRIQASVMQTGMLPLRWLGPGNCVVEAGVLGGDDSSPAPVRAPYWRLPNTDLVRMDEQSVRQAASGCVPEVDGRRYPATGYVEEIVGGFQRAYDLIAEGRGRLFDEALLARLGEQPVRFIFRPTNLYGTVLLKGNHPKYLRDDAKRAEMIGVLAQPLWKLAGRPGLDDILEAERFSLEQMDVPCFHARADSTTLELPTGSRVPGFFDRSALDETRARLASLCDEDRDFQVAVIRMSLHARMWDGLRTTLPEPEQPLPTRAPVGRDFPERAVGEAVRIAGAVEAAAIRGPGEPPGWVGIAYSPVLRGHVATALPSTLFSGSAGIALFLAAVERASGTGRFRPLALEAMAPVRQLARQAASDDGGMDESLRFYFAHHLGVAEGLSGAVYALAHISRLLDAPELLDEACALAALLTPERVRAHPSASAFDGMAGVVLALLALDRLAPGRALARQAAAVAEPLLGFAAAVTGAPEEVRDQLPAGLAMGASGVALALSRLHGATGEDRWLHAAREALALDAARLTGSGVPACVDASWSSGLAGHLVSQVGVCRSAADSRASRTLELLRPYLRTGGDSLCSGALGCADALALAAGALGDATLLEEARGIGAAVLARGRAAGRYRLGCGDGYLHVGLFEGETGVGYALLRLAHPDLFPSVLAWE